MQTAAVHDAHDRAFSWSVALVNLIDTEEKLSRVGSRVHM